MKEVVYHVTVRYFSVLNTDPVSATWKDVSLDDLKSIFAAAIKMSGFISITVSDTAR